MQIENVHGRFFSAPAAKVGELIDGLASSKDRLWPRERWPAMLLDKPLSVGAVGGHGPVRYVIEAYESAQRIVFRFTSPKGFDGVHGFEVVPENQGSRLRHFLTMRVRGTARITWPTVFRPLHDALIEDALDKAERSLGFATVPRSWSLTVRLVRGAIRRVRP